MRKVKLISSLLATVLLVSGLAACGDTGGEATEDPSVTEFEIMGGMSPLSQGYEDNEVLNELADNVGITIEWNTMSSGLSEQVGVEIAGREMPDAFLGVGFNNYDMTTYGSDGTFIDLTEYINEETMPNLTAILEDNPEVRSAITMSDGKIYGLPSGEKMGTGSIGDEDDLSISSVPQFSMINKAWLDELELDMPETIQDLEEVLQAFADNDMSSTYYGNEAGTTIPLSIIYDHWTAGQNIFYSAFGFTNWVNDVIKDIYVDESGNVDFISTKDNYREALEWFHSLFAQGLVDIEMFSQEDSQYIAKTSGGQVGVASWWEIEEIMGENSEDYVYLPPLTDEDGNLGITLRDGGGTTSGNLVITESNENPALLLSYFDQWYQPEIVMQLQYGPIGVFFNEQDENGKWISITNEESMEEFGMSSGELKGTYEVSGPKLILSEYYEDNFYMEARAEQRLTDTRDFWMTYVENTNSYPIDAVFTLEELEVIDIYQTDFENTVAEQESTWIRDGGPTDEEWEAYKTKLVETTGLNELREVYQAAYDRYYDQ